MSQTPALATSTPVQRVEPTVVSSGKRPAAGPACQPPPQNPVEPKPRIIPSSRNEPIGLNVDDFLSGSDDSSAAALSDEEVLAQIRKGHDTMMLILSSRLKNLQTVSAVWTRDGSKVRRVT